MASRPHRGAPRPKRPPPDLPFPVDSPSKHDSKKPRFDYRNPSTLAADAPEEDTVLELDEIGKGGNQIKRNAVNLDGYESDSSEENFDARAAEKERTSKQQQKSKDEEDADMFADLEDDFKDGDDDEELSREGKKKKGVRFLEESDIVGQVADSRSGGHVSANFRVDDKGKGRAGGDGDESSSESGGDEERDRVGSDVDEELGAGAKKKHAPKLDAFNMKAEQEEGRFDESGNFIRKADPDAIHDTWMDGLTKKDMKAAKAAEEKREQDRRKRALADDAMLTSDILSTLITRMDRGETVLEALQRLGTGKKKEKPKPKWQKNKRKATNGANGHEDGDAMDVDATPKDEDPAEKKRRETVEAITGAADQLFSRGQTDIYEQERELLIRQYKRETGEDWVEPEKQEESENGDTKMWEYRWSDARDGGERHGPYDGQTMMAWNDAGYFGEGVEFRRVGETVWERAVISFT